MIKEILRDGLISDGELSEVKNRQISCLEDLGFTVDELETDGSSAIYPSDGREESMEEVVDRTNQAKSQCESETGWYIVSYLYTGTMKNPQNQDISSLMAECLVRVGLQPVGYTAEEYMSDLGAGVYVPYLEDQTTPEAKKFLACNDDPAHAQPVR